MKRRLLPAIALLLPLLSVGLWFAINQIDESLDPRMQAILAQKDSVPAAADNAYFTMVGLYAETTEDMHAAGKRVIDAYRQGLAATGMEPDLDPPEALQDLRDKIRDPCDEGEEQDHCLQRYRQQLPRLVEQLAAQSLLLGRYETLIGMPEYYETSFYLGFSYHLRPHKLWRMRCAREWLQGRHQQAIALLGADIRFHRMLLRNSTLLITRMVAIAILGRDYSLLAEFIRDCATCVQSHPQRQFLLSSLDDRALSMTRVLEREMEFSWTLQNAAGKSSDSAYERYLQAWEWVNVLSEDEPGMFTGFLGYLTLDNATHNEFFADQLPWLALSRLRYQDFFVRLVEQEQTAQIDDRPWYDYLYNPGGKLLLDFSDPIVGYGTYLRRPYDIEARIRLTRLQLAASIENIAAADLPHWLAERPPPDRSPYRDQGPRYDPATASLRFDGHNDEWVEVMLTGKSGQN